MIIWEALKHFDWVEEDEEKEQREELWLDLVRDEEGMLTFFTCSSAKFLARIQAQLLTSRLNRWPNYTANQLVRSSL